MVSYLEAHSKVNNIFCNLVTSKLRNHGLIEKESS